VDVVAIDEFKKLTCGIEDVNSWIELKSFIELRVRDCQFEGRRVLISGRSHREKCKIVLAVDASIYE